MDRSRRDVVRDGYDAVSWVYRGDDDSPPHYRDWSTTLLRRLPAQDATVLDLGCGCGIPVARDLAAAGHHVTGVDISPVQIDRARQLVPAATFLEADLAAVDFPPNSFDAVVSLYALIHLPDAERRRVVEQISTWLRPGATFLATVGVDTHSGTDPDWLGSGTAMWWNHPDVSTFRGWVHTAGLTIDTDRFIPEGDTGHQLIVARAPDREA